jgi:hypothetical protein
MYMEYRAFQYMGSTTVSDSDIAAVVKLDDVTTKLFKWLAPTFSNRSSIEQLKILFATAFMKLAVGKDTECFEVSLTRIVIKYPVCNNVCCFCHDQHVVASYLVSRSMLCYCAL